MIPPPICDKQTNELFVISGKHDLRRYQRWIPGTRRNITRRLPAWRRANADGRLLYRVVLCSDIRISNDGSLLLPSNEDASLTVNQHVLQYCQHIRYSQIISTTEDLTTAVRILYSKGEQAKLLVIDTAQLGNDVHCLNVFENQQPDFVFSRNDREVLLYPHVNVSAIDVEESLASIRGYCGMFTGFVWPKVVKSMIDELIYRRRVDEYEAQYGLPDENDYWLQLL